MFLLSLSFPLWNSKAKKPKIKSKFYDDDERQKWKSEIQIKAKIKKWNGFNKLFKLFLLISLSLSRSQQIKLIVTHTLVFIFIIKKRKWTKRLTITREFTIIFWTSYKLKNVFDLLFRNHSRHNGFSTIFISKKVLFKSFYSIKSFKWHQKLVRPMLILEGSFV